MENWLTYIMNNFGYIGIAFLMALENIFPPIPSEVVLTFGGFMTTQSNLNVTGVVIASTVGSVVGAVALYYFGMVYGMKRMEKIADKWGHILRVDKEDMHKSNEWFKKYEAVAVFICRFVPVMRSLISIPAGMAHMNIYLFLALTTLGTVIWNIVLVYLGAKVGGSWETIVGYMDVYSRVMYGILIVVVIILIVLFIRKKKKR
ncbi:DedA family protein [Salinicoccus sp. ID82-1]|uniref:DedA family protein n=1 Tax=Salinicoccus cyprini TaxID=2493691 RepID=A0A558AYS9_9STAP|nr:MULTISPECIES: DedA family protein [Salinicoccus]MCG1008952.1 DedA family protein [Salinicoccus sp. ID82-1]TVT29406.1 DedA family protein [Salinicoccus cyprini]